MKLEEIPSCGLENMKYFDTKSYHDVDWHLIGDGTYALTAIQGLLINFLCMKCSKLEKSTTLYLMKLY